MVACQQKYENPEQNARITCPICDKSYHEDYFVSEHYFKCSNWTITGSEEKRELYEEAIKKRKASREEEVPVTCYECGKVFNRENSLRRHIRFIHNPDQIFLNCDKCHFKTADKYHLIDHIKRRHTAAVFISCEICGAKIKNTQSSIRQHHFIKHGNHEMVKCKECGKELKKIFYKSHLERVHGERKHVCHLCSYKAQTGYNLKLHISKSHLGVKVLPKDKCHYCEVETTNLPLHMKVHHPLM